MTAGAAPRWARISTAVAYLHAEPHHVCMQNASPPDGAVTEQRAIGRGNFGPEFHGATTGGDFTGRLLGQTMLPTGGRTSKRHTGSEGPDLYGINAVARFQWLKALRRSFSGMNCRALISRQTAILSQTFPIRRKCLQAQTFPIRRKLYRVQTIIAAQTFIAGCKRLFPVCKFSRSLAGNSKKQKGIFLFPFILYYLLIQFY